MQGTFFVWTADLIERIWIYPTNHKVDKGIQNCGKEQVQCTSSSIKIALCSYDAVISLHATNGRHSQKIPLASEVSLFFHPKSRLFGKTESPKPKGFHALNFSWDRVYLRAMPGYRMVTCLNAFPFLWRFIFHPSMKNAGTYCKVKFKNDSVFVSFSVGPE